MSKNDQPAAVELVDAIKRFQDAVDLFDTTAAHVLGINSTDLRCLAVLHDRGPLNAREVAAYLGITRGATTTALDRLQRRQYIARRADSADGRGVIIKLTNKGTECVDAVWGPMLKKGAEHLRTYSVRELHVLQRFFERSIELQATCTVLLRTDGMGSHARTKSGGTA